MMPKTYPATHAAIHTALGQYVVSFSGLARALETAIEHLICSGSIINTKLIMALQANETAHPLNTKFFRVLNLKWNDILEESEKKILQAISNEIVGVIEQRNRYMHDAWYTTRTAGGIVENEHSLMRTWSHSGGVETTATTVTIQELANDTAKIDSLRAMVNALAFYGNDDKPGPNITARFRLVNKKPELIL